MYNIRISFHISAPKTRFIYGPNEPNPESIRHPTESITRAHPSLWCPLKWMYPSSCASTFVYTWLAHHLRNCCNVVPIRIYIRSTDCPEHFIHITQNTWRVSLQYLCDRWKAMVGYRTLVSVMGTESSPPLPTHPRPSSFTIATSKSFT